MADVDALQKVLKIAKEIEIPASMLSKDGVAEVAVQALKIVTELHMEVTTEAENLLLAPDVKGDQIVSTTGSEATSGNSSTHSEPVVHIESDSNSSQSKSSSSSSTNMDDIPIGILFKSKNKGQSPSSKLHKKPSKPVSPFKPMEPPVEVRIGKLLEIRSSKLPPNHPLQPQTIQALNMIIPDKPEDDSVLNNLSSHLSGELPNVFLQHNNIKNNKNISSSQNYVALISPSHLEICRSKMKLLSSTII